MMKERLRRWWKGVVAALAAVIVLLAGSVGSAMAVDYPTGTWFSVDGAKLSSFDPSQGRTTTGSTSGTYTWTVDGTVELHDLPAGWTVSAGETGNGVLYVVDDDDSDTSYRWFFSGATGMVHTTDELRGVELTAHCLTVTVDASTQNGGTFDGTCNTTSQGYSNVPTGWAIGMGSDSGTGARTFKAYVADDLSTVKATWTINKYTPANMMSDVIAVLNDGSLVTGFDGTDEQNLEYYIPDGMSVTLENLPDGYTQQGYENTSGDRYIVRVYDSNGDRYRTYIFYYEDEEDYTYTYRVEQLSDVTAESDGKTVDGFTYTGGEWQVDGDTVTLTGIPDGWDQTRTEGDHTLTITVSSPDGTISVGYVFDLPYHATELAGVTVTVDGANLDGFDPTVSGEYSIPTSKSEIQINDIPDGWMLIHEDGSGTYTVVSADLRTSVEWTFTPLSTVWTVSFDTDDDSDVVEQLVEDEMTVTEPENPTRDGYRFDGWYQGDDLYDFSTPVTSDITLVAHWTRLYTVTFDYADGSTTGMMTVEAGSTVSEPDAPSRDGYRFDGWYQDDDLYDFSTPVTSDITLTAKWTRLHTVSFDTNGGSTVASQSIVDGEAATEPEDPVRDGYRFDGWLLDGEEYDFATPVTGDVTLTARWVRVWTVSFDTGDGTTVADQTVDDGGTVTEPDDPVRDGYTFYGWLLDDAVYDFGTPVTGDVTLTAVWTKDGTVTIVYHANDGTSRISMQTVESNTQTTIADATLISPDRDCANLVEWNTEADGSGYYRNLGQTNTPVLYDDGRVFLSCVKCKCGEYFATDDDWEAHDKEMIRQGDYSHGSYSVVYCQFGENGIIDLYAQWDETDCPTSYTVTFDTNGGTKVESQTVDYRGTATEPEDPVRDGYRFDGWTLDGEDYDFSTPVKADITLTAKWTELHTVTFDHGNGGDPDTVTVADGDTVTRPADPTRDGYTFDGWQLDGESYDFATPVTGDITLVASWTRITHTVTFDSDGGSGVEDQTVGDGDTADEPEDPVRDGYEFAGWQLDGEPYDFSTPVTADITLVASWTEVTEPDGPDEPVTHTVSFDSDGGSDVENQTVTDGDAADEPDDPVRDGYTFTGWYLDGEPYDFNTPVTGDITLVAGWEENADTSEPDTPAAHTVTFDSDGGSDVESQTVEDGGTADEPDDPSRDGYTFTGWYLDGDPYDFNTPVTGDITLIAGWEENADTGEPDEPDTPITHTVSFDPNGGSDVESQTVKDGDTADEPDEPSRDGYEFAGWTLNGEAYDFNTPVTADITLVASWTRITHIVSFDSAGGSTVPVQTVEDGDTVSKPDDPTRDGYTFDGWTLDGEDYDFDTPVTSDITLVASWVENTVTYTVRFRTNGGSAVASQTIPEGGTATRPDDPTRNGYEFAGWQLNGEDYDFDTPVTADIILDAVWTVVESNPLDGITAVLGDGTVDGFDPTVSGEYVIPAGSTVTVSGIPDGWMVTQSETDTGVTYTITDGDTTVTWTFTYEDSGDGSDTGDTGDTGDGSDTGDTGDSGDGSGPGDSGDAGDGSDTGDTGSGGSDGTDTGDTGSDDSGTGADSGDDSGDGSDAGADGSDSGTATGDGDGSADTGSDDTDSTDTGADDDSEDDSDGSESTLVQTGVTGFAATAAAGLLLAAGILLRRRMTRHHD